LTVPKVIVGARNIILAWWRSTLESPDLSKLSKVDAQMIKLHSRKGVSGAIRAMFLATVFFIMVVSLFVYTGLLNGYNQTVVDRASEVVPLFRGLTPLCAWSKIPASEAIFLG